MPTANTADVQRQQRLLKKQQILQFVEGIYWQSAHALFAVVSFGSKIPPPYPLSYQIMG
jgi:hypothetical protein